MTGGGSAQTVTGTGIASGEAFGAASVRMFRPAGKPFLYTAANWAAPVFYLELEFRAITGTALASLKNETDSTYVEASEVNTTSLTHSRVRSASFSLTDGKTYRAHVGKVSGDSGAYKSIDLLSC